jgi:hypothetical protein
MGDSLERTSGMGRWSKATAATTFLATMLSCLTAQAQERAPNWRINEPIPTVWESSVDTATHSPSDKKLILGARMGFGIPIGKVNGYATVDISHSVVGEIPLWLDIGYMVTPDVMLGAYGQFAPLVTRNCDTGASCRGSNVRVGIQAQFLLSTVEKVNPWVGFGFGYEILSLDERLTGDEVTASARGFELAHLQAGVDLRVTPALGIGPFVGYSIGQFSRATTSNAVGSTSRDLVNPVMHEWFEFGVRGVLAL